VYDLYNGEECGGSSGRNSFAVVTKSAFLYFDVDEQVWYIGGCDVSGKVAFGGAGFQPFRDTDDTWYCADDGMPVLRGMSITCSMYRGETEHCRLGTYNASSTGPEGRCFPCPDARPWTSSTGARFVTDCITLFDNMYIMSQRNDRLVALNADKSHFELLMEDRLQQPLGITFVNKTTALIANSHEHAIIATNSEGEFTGVFAHLSNPSNIVHLEELGVISSSTLLYMNELSEPVKGLAFFNVSIYEERGTLSTSSPDDYTVAPIIGYPLIGICQGERPDEVLIGSYTVQVSLVERVCVPNTSCKPAKRNSVMLTGTFDFGGIGVLRDRFFLLSCISRD
jgi:hypothetical protein